MEPGDWLRVDDAFGDQMALRDALILAKSGDVHAMLPSAEAAAQECLDLVLAHCSDHKRYDVTDADVIRPDGVKIAISFEAPLLTIGRLVQEDICILLPSDAGHVLSAAILCFPASWTLHEKIGKPLPAIHQPVAEYDDQISRRVQRLFDGVKVEQPMWRGNALTYASPELFHPRREADGHRPTTEAPNYLRSERQTITRLPETGAVVFAIHTYLWACESLPDEVRAIFLD